MQLFEEKEYWEVFTKDTRNKRANGGTNKRNNVKELKKRVQRILERQEQEDDCPKVIFEEATDDEDGKVRKYTNGKPKKEVKKQTHYNEEVDQVFPQEKKKKQHKKIGN